MTRYQYSTGIHRINPFYTSNIMQLKTLNRGCTCKICTEPLIKGEIVGSALVHVAGSGGFKISGALCLNCSTKQIEYNLKDNLGTYYHQEYISYQLELKKQIPLADIKNKSNEDIVKKKMALRLKNNNH